MLLVIAGQDGKTKFAIENATRTRIVVANTKIHILGSFQNIKVARNALCSLIMGSPPGKVYNRMRELRAGQIARDFDFLNDKQHHHSDLSVALDRPPAPALLQASHYRDRY